MADSKRERAAFVAGTGLLVIGGMLSVPALMFAGLVLLAISRRILANAKEDTRENTQGSSVVVAVPLDGERVPKPVPLAVRVLAAAAVVVVLALFASFFPSSTPPPKQQRWTFIDDSFATKAAWSIEHHGAATGGRALSKEAGSSALLVVTTSPARDVRAMTRCKGEACGLAFRIADERNHSVVRVASDRVELVRVAKGAETVLASAPLAAAGEDVWQELAVEARGDLVRVTVNGARAIEHHDPRPAITGGVGLWAPARAWFDELTIEVLATSPQTVEVLPFLRRAS